ncbi:unnamed protein product [Linum tenue]|uniref:CUE domain-containing protein n=1 Tax=Linum tenue TaxID=586396 RepID=A0AAV0S8X6_9ROSI|nr:unnamed protein product [Linum tenue]
MSAIVCGKRSFFEELNVTSPPVNKRIRCSSSSPVRFSPPRPSPASSFSTPPRAPVVSSASAHLVEQLAAIFPEMDKELLERALAECGEDLDSAIRSLNELRLGSADKNLDSDGGKCDGLLDANGNVQGNALFQTFDPSIPTHVQMDGAEWVELFVREMTSASNMDDAKARASRALEALEKSIYARAGAEAVKNFQLENLKLKEQVQLLIHENTILKRAVTIQHERQKEFDDRNQELQHLKQLVAQYQDQLRTLEVCGTS